MDRRELNLLLVDYQGNTIKLCIQPENINAFYAISEIDISKAKRNKGKRELHNTVNDFMKEIKEKVK